MVGENDCGKTTVIDAIRYALLTRDLDYIRARSDDFYVDETGEAAAEITIRCKLTRLSEGERGAFAEHLTYEDAEPVVYIFWRARRVPMQASRRVAEVSVRSGPNGAGQVIDGSVRQLLAAAYLRPLRDAEREMSAGQGSRLAQVLASFRGIEAGEPFDRTEMPQTLAEAETLSLGGMADYFRYLVNQHPGIRDAQRAINDDYLSKLGLAGEALSGHLDYTQAGTASARLRQILERLELDLAGTDAGTGRGRYGLGSNNLLFMACELLLLGSESEGLPLLLVEEPEAHLHPQRQLRLMEFLASAAGNTDGKGTCVQVILTTHSPNLSSKIPLDNLVLIERAQAFPMTQGATRLHRSDYRFLERFLDSTKANLFFARGILVVEGDSEAILVPVLARLIGRDLTASGVSIVNVGGTGLRRYARILQRAEGAECDDITVPVACLADMDVMPDCAPKILGLVEDDDDEKWKSSQRRWRAKRDFGDQETSQDDALAAHAARLRADDHANVRTFVADQWTFEYDLAFSGLAEEVFVAATLAEQDEAINAGTKNRSDVVSAARVGFQALVAQFACDTESLCSAVYSRFASGRASKAIAAQYLEDRFMPGGTVEPGLMVAKRLPDYIVEAIEYAARSGHPTGQGCGQSHFRCSAGLFRRAAARGRGASRLSRGPLWPFCRLAGPLALACGY